MKYLLWIYSVILFSCLFSCVKEIDKNAPEVSLIFNNEILLDTITVDAGEELSFQIQLSDDFGLYSYRFFIDFLNKEESSECEVNSEWSELQVEDLSEENQYSTIATVQIPDSVHGFYGMNLSAFDINGNLTEEEFVVRIVNLNLPQSIVLQTDSIVSSCKYFIDDIDNPEVQLEASSVNGISAIQFFKSTFLELSLNASFEISNDNYLNSNFMLNPLDSISEIDTILVRLVDSQNVSHWSQIELEK